MKEAVGESSMTLVTIVLVGAVITGVSTIIGFLIGNQSRRANCENNGYDYVGGVCKLPDGDCRKVNSDGICED